MSEKKQETFLDRLFVEREELEKKFSKLREFIYLYQGATSNTYTKEFNKLSYSSRRLLKKQLKIMKKYLWVLELRINVIRMEGR